MLGCEVAFGELCERGQMPVIRSMHEASIAAAFDGSSGGQVALQKSTKTVPTILKFISSLGFSTNYYYTLNFNFIYYNRFNYVFMNAKIR